MHYIQVIAEYICHQFPWLRGSQFSYEPLKKTVYIYCQHLSEPEILLEEAEAFAKLDIGVACFIIMMPEVMEMVIECRPNQYKESL